jgi:hypothetical protein
MANVLPNPDVKREQCVNECKGCQKMFSDENIGDVCIAYVNPKAIHRIGCSLKTNKELEYIKAQKLNPIKASKRSRRKG